MKATKKAEQLRQKLAAMKAELKAAEAAEREEKRAEDQRAKRRAERVILTAATRAGLLALPIDSNDLEREFEVLARRLSGNQMDDKQNETQEVSEDERDGGIRSF